MTTATMSYGMRARERMPFAWDPITLGLTAACCWSAWSWSPRHPCRSPRATWAIHSIFSTPIHFPALRVAARLDGQPGPAELWDKYGLVLLLFALLLLTLVLIPGIGRPCKRCTPLASDRRSEFPSLGTRQGAGAHLGVQLLRAQARRAGDHAAGSVEALRPACRDGDSVARRTGLRRRHGAHRHRIRRVVRGRRAAALRGAASFLRVCRFCAARVDLVLSFEAAAHFPASLR